MSDAVTAPPAKSILGRLGAPGFVVELVRVMSPPAVRLLGAGIQFLSTVLIARQLGDDKSAGFFFWSAVLTSFAPIATYGLEHLALRTVPRLHESESPEGLVRYLSSIRTISLVVSALIGIGLFIYASLRNDAEGAGWQSWQMLLPLALCAMAIALINGEALKGLARPVAGIFFSHFVPVSLFCVLISANLERLSSPFLIVLYTAAYVAGLVLVRLGPSTALRSKLFSVPDQRQLSGILSEGFPVFASNALGALCFIVPLMILDVSRAAAEVAYVTTSFRISILFTILATSIHGVFAPQLSRAAARPGNARELWRVYWRTTGKTLLAFALPFSIGIAFPELIMSVFGDEFRAGADTLRVLLICGMISLCLGPMLQLLVMTGNTQLLARLGVIKLLAVSVLAIGLVPRFGGIGMVSTMGFVFIAESIAGLLLVARQLSRQKTAHPTES